MTCDCFLGKAKVGLRAVASVSENVFATGGGDASISMWDMRMKKAIALLQVLVVVVVVVVVVEMEEEVLMRGGAGSRERGVCAGELRRRCACERQC